MTPLPQRLREKLANDDERTIATAQEYADRASPELFEQEDWHMCLRTGYLGGTRESHARLAPLHEALIAAVKALEHYKCARCVANIGCYAYGSCKALSRLAECLGEE